MRRLGHGVWLGLAVLLLSGAVSARAATGRRRC